MAALGLGLLVEEHRAAVAADWRRAVERETCEPALAFAVGPLLREMSLALRKGRRAARPGSGEGWARCAVLVRSSAQSAQVAHEFRLLRRALWEVLQAQRYPLSLDERRAADEWVDEALECSLERLEWVRARREGLEKGSDFPARTPPPLPVRRGPARVAGFEGVLEAKPGESAATPA